MAAKKGRKPKKTRTLKIELHSQAYSWLEFLHAKGRFGNSVQNVALNLLDHRFKQLLQEGELYEVHPSGNAIPFPSPKENDERSQTEKTEQPTKTY